MTGKTRTSARAATPSSRRARARRISGRALLVGLLLLGAVAACGETAAPEPSAAAGAAPEPSTAQEAAPEPSAAVEPGPAVLVIPAGREAVIQRLVGAEGATAAGCRFQSAAIEVTVVRASYDCPGVEGPVGIELRAPDPASPALARTRHFRIVAGTGPVAPAPFVAWLEQNVRAHEGTWEWARALRDTAMAEEERPEPPDEPPVDPAYLRRYEEIDALYRQARHEEALAIALDLARENPRYGGILAMVVANLAPQSPDAERVAALVRAADERPDDPLSQFVAAIAAHYSGHYTAQTREEKKRLYRLAIRYLERTRPAFDFEPRVHIYLAVSHFRLEHQELAEAHIEDALRMDRKDPDAYYCRAEIWQRKDPARALQDLERYIEIMSGEEHVAMGEKSQTVLRMRDRLQARIRGESDDEELWDPLTSH